MQIIKNHGFSLIEVLIALFILSFGLFAFMQSELDALHDMQVNYWRTLAQLQITSLQEHFVIHPYSSGQSWQNQIEKTFPAGRGLINSQKITVQWRLHKQSYVVTETIVK